MLDRVTLLMQRYNVQACEVSLPVVADDTQEAARTIATVESHLRHLQLQHAEAQQRMNELTRQARVGSRWQREKLGVIGRRMG